MQAEVHTGPGRNCHHPPTRHRPLFQPPVTAASATPLFLKPCCNPFPSNATLGPPSPAVKRLLLSTCRLCASGQQRQGQGHAHR